MVNKRVLIIEDDLAFGKMLQNFMTTKGFEVDHCMTGVSGRKLLQDNSYDLLISDLKLPDDSGMDILKFVKSLPNSIPTVLMTSYADVATAVEAIKQGAEDYISKPFRPEELLMVVDQAINTEEDGPEKILKSNQKLKTLSAETVNGNSQASKKFNQYLSIVAPTDMCVLIQGESGTGKEVAAKKIHDLSERSTKTFVAVDCGAIPEEIAASEFFGHIKGSFTGAVNDKKGHFEAADGGTLFLDEVGNLSYQNQIQLLRALQERKIKPVGSNKEIAVDVRILSATNENLLQAVEEGRFREDLYHRLNEFSIDIPPLRERKEDLLLFIDFFLQEANQQLNKNVIGMEPDVQEAFYNYEWPGNLRELRNIIKRSVLLTQGDFIPLDVIPKEVCSKEENELIQSSNLKLVSKEDFEKQAILQALEKTGNNKSKAAEMLNMARKTLYNKIKLYNLE